MQRPLITVEGGKPKTRLGLASAYAVCGVAILLPGRARVLFVFAVNFLCNRLLATALIALSFMGRRTSGLLIFLSYFLVLGPTALLARLLGADYLGTAEAGSFFRPKGPPDERERLERQY